MTHTHSKLYYHVVWSTKNREQFLTKAVQGRLYSYIGGIIKNLGGSLLSIGGIEDHVHLLLYTKPDMLLSELVKQIKSRSTKWINAELTKEFAGLKNFKWQEGYGIFSISFWMLEDVENYILEQEDHHKNMSYDQEYLMLLKKYQIQFDPRFVLG